MSQQVLILSASDDSIPTRPLPNEQELMALKEAVRKITALLEASGVKEEEIIADFREARQREITAQQEQKNCSRCKKA